ncbi:MAG: GNAT family N-acetyltransferase [Dehalococcoidia bacterium]|nr:GNAT family N-acetyltransferase [Dehalococcoidia bacterium]
MTTVTWAIEELPARGPLFDGAIRVYADAFAQPPYSDPDRGREVRSRLRSVHRSRPNFRGFIAKTPGGEVAGMCYGYHGEHGQWWHDMVRNALTAEQARDWLSDSYELVELAVSPAYQGRGIGRALIERLLEDCDEATCVLSTRTDSQAHELYRRMGFEVITIMAFAPQGAPFYVMGKVLR